MKVQQMIGCFCALFLSHAVLACPITSVNDLASGLNAVDVDCVIDKQSLFERRAGFAKSVYGGHRSDQVYLVTSLADSGAGTLRDALTNDGVWVVFGVSGTIQLASKLTVPSNVTIDGRGASIRLVNYGLKIWDVRNVIVENLIIENGDASTTDAIEVVRSNLVWIDHTTLRNFPDGLLDIKYAPQEKTRVTASWNRFENHNKTMLIGLHKQHAINDRNIYVTLHHNYFAATGQRHPRVSQGYVHVYNNVLLWKVRGAQSYDNARLLMEGNFFSTLNPQNLQATAYDLNNPDIPLGKIRAPMAGYNANMVIGNDSIQVLENGTVGNPSYSYVAEQATACVYYNVTLNAGYHFDAESDVNSSINSPAIPNSPLACN